VQSVLNGARVIIFVIKLTLGFMRKPIRCDTGDTRDTNDTAREIYAYVRVCACVRLSKLRLVSNGVSRNASDVNGTRLAVVSPDKISNSKF